MASYYETLSVSTDATPDEIKKAYRRLAMQHHPDRNPGDQSAIDKFRQITEAYEILSNDQKRQAYDAQSSGAFRGPKPHDHNFHGSMEDILSKFFSQHGFGGFAREPARNRDISLSLTISLEEAYAGKQYPLSISSPSGRRIDVIVNVPAGIESGVRIRYQGQGDHANTSLPPGDLYIMIQIADHDRFKRTGSTLETVAVVDCITAAIGGRTQVTCINGQEVSIAIPAGTQHGTRIRLPGRGMPLHPSSTDHGDFLVAVQISIPTGLADDVKSLLTDVQQKRGLDTF